ncbi:MAG: TonB-dependent receptor [Bacteroidales bacterium]|nr:TonB-dependent receptor [Bacteroidales bacterium]
MLTKRYIIFLLLLLLATLGWGQARLEGRVTSAGSDLEFVTVVARWQNGSASTRTDRRGLWSLSVSEKDSIRLTFQLMGYQDSSLTLAPIGKKGRSVNVSLREQSSQLNQVDVVGERSSTGNYTHINLADIENIAGPNEGVESVLKTLPDVASNNELSSQYSVRGGSFDENLVYINDVEVFRPQLVHSGQQEGMSIINADMVDHLTFSPGGFESVYGDKMSSVLDIKYKRPSEFHAKLSGSLLGGAAWAQGTIKNFWYNVGFRYHSNRYLFSSLDTKGHYSTAYTDIQALMGYRVNDKVDLSLLAIWTRNRYGLIPESQTTTFGNFMHSMELDIYFDGQETDKYSTLLGSFSVDYHPNDNFNLKWITSVQSNDEAELYDIQDQYWLYELALGSQMGQVDKFDRGVGTFLEHARNYLRTGIYSTEVRGTHYAKLGNWRWGAKVQFESTDDRINEWKWVDSAGFSIPTTYETPGDSLNQPYNPILQFYSKAHNNVYTLRTTAFLQRDFNWITDWGTDLQLVVGTRFQYYHMWIESDALNNSSNQAIKHSNNQAFVSPRVSFAFKPNIKTDLRFRTTAGVYQQAPFYREMRRTDGSLNPNVHAQRSYQIVESIDWNFKLFKKPFRLTTDVYAKYVDNLIPYSIDNLRIRYTGDNNAEGYAVGMSMRLNGEFVEGLESWASISLMQTRENIKGDGYGWQPRPTDQIFSFKTFLQDYIPKIPWWRMSLSLIVGTGLPVTFPYQTDRSSDFRLPTYFRVDWGNSVQLSRFKKLANTKFFRVVDDVMIGVDVFNLFNYHNVVSYLWVADYENIYYPVPNYLTARQFNVKVTITF